MIILRRPMKDFVGLENVDESIKSAIMKFSHYLTVGNMDEMAATAELTSYFPNSPSSFLLVHPPLIFDPV